MTPTSPRMLPVPPDSAFLGSVSPAPRLEAVVAFLALALAPHALRLPPWITGLCLAAWGYALATPRRGWRLPGRRLLQVLTLAAVTLAVVEAVISTGSSKSLAGGVAVLATVMGLKPLESVARRDHMAAILLGMFLVLSNLFYSESMAMAGYLLAAALGACMVFMHLVRPQEGFRPLLNQASRLLLQGAPVMLVLFFLFPRLPGGLFGLPPNAAPIGFDDNMTLGAVGRLVRDETLVFRAEFENATPPAVNQLYWRGLTLWEFDGRGWLKGQEPEQERTVLRGTLPISYTIILEPMNTRWLFALDKPVQAAGAFPYWAMLHNDRTLRAFRPVSQRRRYSVVSFLNSYDPASEDAVRAGLLLPARGNPRARALGEQLARDIAAPEARVQAMLQRFREEPFVYTLAPQALGADPIDGFLFGTRQGFCEHFAAAFAYVMRAAGVPARVTLGYLGGLVNPLGGHVEVRQAEAHAWAEVVLPGRGWVRVDPTGAVAPERVMIGLEAALSAEDLARHFHRDTSPLVHWPWLRNALETLSYQWYDMVLSYGSLRQFQMLRDLGLDLRTLRGRLGLAVALAVLLAGATAMVLWWQRRRRPGITRREDPVAALYRTFCSRLATAGLPREPALGPVEYGRRIEAFRPDLAPEALEILRRYIALAYMPPDASGVPLPDGVKDRAGQLRVLAQLVRDFRPRPAQPRHAAAIVPENRSDPAG
ncbi:transglutaminase TgpA family protein [Megalodesulfovibrio paquesii]